MPGEVPRDPVINPLTGETARPTEPERLTAEDRAHLAYLVEWARYAFKASGVSIQPGVIIRLAAHLERVEQALGAYADLDNWDQDHWACRLGAWQGDEVGPDLAREALGLPKVGEEQS